MRSFGSTWLMALLVAGIGAYTVYDYRKSTDAVLAENERMAFSLTPSDVTELKIVRDGETVVIAKSGEQWQMSEPVKDLADMPSVNGYLYTLLAQRVRTFRTGEEVKKTPDWVESGLDKPAVTIEVAGGGKSESLSVGSKNAFDGSFFIREKDELLLGDSSFAQLRDRLANTFRSRRVWREGGKPEIAVVKSLNKSFTLLKKDGQWTIDPKPSFDVDPEKIEEWMERIVEFSPSYIEKDGITEDDKRAYLLVKPSFTAAINVEWKMTAGQDRAEDVFVFTNQRDTLYKVSANGLSEIRVTPEFFRDGRKAFHFPLEEVRKIEVTIKDKKRVITKNGSDWSLPAEDAQGFELDLSKLATFLQNVRSLSGKEFFAKGEGFPASPQIMMKDGSDRALFSLAWGASVPKKNDVFVRTNLEKEVMSLSREKIDELIPHEMVRKKK